MNVVVFFFFSFVLDLYVARNFLLYFFVRVVDDNFATPVIPSTHCIPTPNGTLIADNKTLNQWWATFLQLRVEKLIFCQ